MPIVEITMIEGRSGAQKAALMKAVTGAIADSIGAAADSVRIIIREIPPEHFGVGGVAKGKPGG